MQYHSSLTSEIYLEKKPGSKIAGSRYFEKNVEAIDIKWAARKSLCHYSKNLEGVKELMRGEKWTLEGGKLTRRSIVFTITVQPVEE